MRAEELGLIQPALGWAIEIQAKFPDVVFTSGRRSVDDQARAMAQNVAANREWIAETYVYSLASTELQAVVDKLPHTASVPNIQAALSAEMNTWGDAMKAKLSKHFSGEAFDIQPMNGQRGAAVQAFIATLGVGKFLTREGGLVRWHIQV